MSRAQKSGSRKAGQTVDAYMQGLVHPHKAAIQGLREFILSIDARIKEEVKWNAPSFYINDNFATLRLHPVPIFQLVLHNGSKKVASPKQFVIPDPQGIVKWAAKDRCVVSFSSLADSRSKMIALKPIIVSWIPQL